MQLDEAIAKTVGQLQQGAAAGNTADHDLNPDHVLNRVAEHSFTDGAKQARFREECRLIFADAAWELCRRGLVRPGPKIPGRATVSGVYSLTVAGSAALPNLVDNNLLLLQPGSLAKTLDHFAIRFGEGFGQRAQEAVSCLTAGAWFGCCAMAGAAAESVLLALAVEKAVDEKKVLKAYRGSRGRREVLKIVLKGINDFRSDKLTAFASIIAYWRDAAAHGQAKPISSANADLALRTLLDMCQWADEEWDALTSPAEEG